MLLLRYIGGCIIWFIILLYFVAIIGLGFGFFYISKNQDINPIMVDPQTLQIIAYLCWGIAGISFLIFLCTCSKIKIAIAIIKAAADFTR